MGSRKSYLDKNICEILFRIVSRSLNFPFFIIGLKDTSYIS